MPRMQAAGRLAAILLLACSAAWACPPAQPPRFELKVEDPDPDLDLSRDVAGLHLLQGRPPPAAIAGSSSSLGLTVVRMQWRADLTAAVEGRCARPQTLRMVLRHAEHSVLVAREVGSGCLFRQVLAHEERHVAANRAALRAAEEALRRRILAWWPEGTADSAASLRTALRDVIEEELTVIRRTRDEAHAEIDAPMEYRRLASVCPADQTRLRARLRGLEPP